MFVPGAMVAIWAATVIITPAEAAPAPLGPTHTATGIGEFNMALIMVRMEEPNPPGVSRRSMASPAPCLAAFSRPLVTYMAVPGLIGPSSSIMKTSFSARAIPDVPKPGIPNIARLIKTKQKKAVVLCLAIFYDLQAQGLCGSPRCFMIFLISSHT